MHYEIDQCIDSNLAGSSPEKCQHISGEQWPHRAGKRLVFDGKQSAHVKFLERKAKALKSQRSQISPPGADVFVSSQGCRDPSRTSNERISYIKSELLRVSHAQ